MRSSWRKMWWGSLSLSWSVEKKLRRMGACELATPAPDGNIRTYVLAIKLKTFFNSTGEERRTSKWKLDMLCTATSVRLMTRSLARPGTRRVQKQAQNCRYDLFRTVNITGSIHSCAGYPPSPLADRRLLRLLRPVLAPARLPPSDTALKPVRCLARTNSALMSVELTRSRAPRTRWYLTPGQS